MKIGYFADGVWAHQALDRILTSPELSVAFIVARFKQPDPVLRAYAERLGVPFLTAPNVNDPAFLDRIRCYTADVHVSMSFDQILRAEILRLAPRGFINCHAGGLPFYRGRNVLNWALINGEERFGVTVHYVDEGIDTGDIIVQRWETIRPEDDYGSVLARAAALCAEVLHEALLDIRADRARRLSQETIHPVGFYCSQRREGDEWLDWSWPSQRIHNLVRAITRPGPGARTTCNGAPLALLRTELIEGAPAYIDRPGTVVGRSSRGVVVKTGDTTLLVTAVSDVGPDGRLVEERVPAFRIGTVLGLPGWSELEALRNRVALLEAALTRLQERVAQPNGENAKLGER